MTWLVVEHAPAFDAAGTPVIYRTAPEAWVCSTCLRRGREARVVDVLPRSGGTLGRCDGCGQLAPPARGPTCRAVATWLREGLLHLELDPEVDELVWAELLGTPSHDAPRGLEVRVGDAVYRCVVERVR